MWFRRDLRLADNPALLSAVSDATDARVVPLFVLDPALWRPAGPARRAYLAASLTDLGNRVGGLLLRRGDPVEEVVAVARAARATAVHIAEDFGPYGRQRDHDVEAALARHDIALVRTGSPYAVAPGRVVNKNRRCLPDVHAVFPRLARARLARATDATSASLVDATPEERPPRRRTDPGNLRLPAAGESAAHRRWREFVEQRLDDYGTTRDRADLDSTSRMSVHLKWGEIHPRTLLADLGRQRSEGAATYRTELAWREFFADVLWRSPGSAREYLKPRFARMEYDEPGGSFAAWRDGRTGYPIVDAGMRQLRSEGWVHNRIRMLAASFLVKDLHVEWRHGARHFMRWLVDGDLASNQHGWQWTAGCGTDAAPYFRIFNPTVQGKRFDPHGDYVRRYVPELRHVDATSIHEPWTLDGGPPRGYPTPIVDHGAERRESLRRFEMLRA